MMRRALLIAGVLWSTTAPGDDLFRCGSWVISSSISVDELKAKCGEPTSKSVKTEDVLVRTPAGGTNKTGTTTLERWIYDRGSGSFKMVVTIRDGKITKLERGQ